MSYSASASLQKAVFTALRSDAQINNIIGDAIFDATPTDDTSQFYITLGDEQVRRRGTFQDSLLVHRFKLSVVSNQTGYAKAKEVAGIASDCILLNEFQLDTGRIVDIVFDNARAQKTEDLIGRQIDIWFRATIEI